MSRCPQTGKLRNDPSDFPVRDPADELIVATARVHKLTLLTTDTKLKDYRHARIRYFTPVAHP